MEKVIIEINENFDIYVSVKNNYGIYNKKPIGVEELYNALCECNGKRQSKIVTKKKDILYRSPLMPNFNDVHILQHIIIDKNREVVMLQRKAKRSKVAFYNDVLEDVGMPSLIFMVYIIDKKISSARVVAVKDKLIREDTMLYNYPLTNVFYDGSVCFGSNRLKDYEVDDTFNNLHSFPNMFLMMPATHELKHQNGYNMELRPLLNYLKGKDFDDSKLIETGTTYKQWVNKCI